MQELIKVNMNDAQEPIVSGRELYAFLGVETPYRIWFPRMTEYGFVENVDFIGFEQICTKPQGGRPTIDHLLKLPMAKEIAMIQRTEKGKQARQYFLELEKAWNSPEKIMARALQFANAQLMNFSEHVKRLEGKIEADKPKTIFADAVASSHSTILIGDLAKILRQNGYPTGQNRLFKELRALGFLIGSGSSKNMPSQKGMELKLFEVKETVVSNADGSIRVTKTTKVTGKGQQYFVNMFLKSPLHMKMRCEA